MLDSPRFGRIFQVKSSDLRRLYPYSQPANIHSPTKLKMKLLSNNLRSNQNHSEKLPKKLAYPRFFPIPRWKFSGTSSLTKNFLPVKPGHGFPCSATRIPCPMSGFIGWMCFPGNRISAVGINKKKMLLCNDAWVVF